MSLSKEIDMAQAQRPVPCDSCEGEIPGIYYCIQCKKTLCEECEKFHNKFTKGHKVVLRVHISDIDTSILTCTDHDDEASFHCEKCDVPICPECVTMKHQGHKMENLENIMKKKKELLQRNIDELRNVTLAKLEKEQQKIRTGRESYNQKIQEMANDMENINEDLHKELDEIHQERSKRMREIQHRHLSMYDGHAGEIETKLEVCKRRILELEDVLTKNSLAAIFNFVPPNEPPPQIPDRAVLPQPPSFIPGNVQGIIGNIEKMQVADDSLISKSLRETTPTIISKFKSPLKGYPRICISKEGDVWLGGQDTKELVSVDFKGHVLKNRNIQARPDMIAIMDCDDLIISPFYEDESVVRRLTTNGTFINIFNAAPSRMYGVSVTADQKILNCTWDGRVVRTDAVAEDVRQLYRGSGDDTAMHAVENADGNIYVTDARNSAIVIISKNGNFLTSINKTRNGRKMEWPIGLVLDKKGNILCSDMKACKIYIIDQDQKTKKLLGPSDGIFEPRWLAIDRDSNLWITQRDGFVIVVKYLV